MIDLNKDDLIIKLSKEYQFEENKYSDIDLTRLEFITASELIKAENAVKRNNKTEVLPEMTLEYACYIAHYATTIPVEFFMQLNAKDSIKLKTTIQGFFYSED